MANAPVKIWGKFSQYLSEVAQHIPDYHLMDNDSKCKAILDSLTVNQCNRVNLEAASRQFLFSLHSKRQHILNTAPE